MSVPLMTARAARDLVHNFCSLTRVHRRNVASVQSIQIVRPLFTEGCNTTIDAPCEWANQSNTREWNYSPPAVQRTARKAANTNISMVQFSGMCQSSCCCKVAVILNSAKLLPLQGEEWRWVWNSQVLKSKHSKLLILLVAGGGIEPPTLGL